MVKGEYKMVLKNLEMILDEIYEWWCFSVMGFWGCGVGVEGSSIFVEDLLGSKFEFDVIFVVLEVFEDDSCSNFVFEDDLEI